MYTVALTQDGEIKAHKTTLLIDCKLQCTTIRHYTHIRNVQSENKAIQMAIPTFVKAIFAKHPQRWIEHTNNLDTSNGHLTLPQVQRQMIFSAIARFPTQKKAAQYLGINEIKLSRELKKLRGETNEKDDVDFDYSIN